MLYILAILLTIIVGAVIALAIYFHIETHEMRIHSEKIPGPKTIPFFGNALEAGGLFANEYDFFQTIIRLSKQYGPVVRGWGWKFLVIQVSDPKIVEVILSDNTLLEKGINYKVLFPWLGNGLLTSSGEHWKKHRKIITPTFHFKILEDFLHVFNENGNKLIKKLKSNINGPEFDIYKYIQLCTLDIICETAMGISINAQEKENSDYVKAVRMLTTLTVKITMKPWMEFRILFKMSKLGQAMREALEIVHNMSRKVIKARKEEFLRKKTLKPGDMKIEEADIGVKKRMAFLDMLLEASQNNSVLSDEDVREEVDTFMFEGHDTTSSAISFTLSCLAQYSEIQDKVYQEQREIFGNSDREPTSHDIQNMKYLEMVVKETLRMYPSVPMFVRRVSKDIKYGPYTFPKGSNICIFTFLMHRDPELFPEPEKFIPERFLPENCQRRHPFQYVPFSAGSRNCIGQKFAMLEIKSLLSKIVRSFNILPGSTTNKVEELTLELVLKNINGIKVRLQERN